MRPRRQQQVSVATQSTDLLQNTWSIATCCVIVFSSDGVVSDVSSSSKTQQHPPTSLSFCPVRTKEHPGRQVSVHSLPASSSPSRTAAERKTLRPPARPEARVVFLQSLAPASRHCSARCLVRGATTTAYSVGRSCHRRRPAFLQLPCVRASLSLSLLVDLREGTETSSAKPDPDTKVSVLYPSVANRQFIRAACRLQRASLLTTRRLLLIFASSTATCCEAQ